MSCARLSLLLKKAVEKEVNDRAFELWKSVFPLMMAKLIPFVPFEEVKMNMSKGIYTDISNEKIEAEMSEIVEKNRKVG